VRPETQLVTFNSQVCWGQCSKDRRALTSVARQLSLEGQGLEGVEGLLGAAFGSGERQAGVLVGIGGLEHLEAFFVAGNGGHGLRDRVERLGAAFSAFVSLQTNYIYIQVLQYENEKITC
jgi:hypothetical protein